ncbi:MAG: hypothetical protein Q9226_006214 [Calogaya cf. arnoldii]
MPNLVQGPVSNMDNHASGATNSEKPKATRDQFLERLATSNLTAVQAYMRHHPADEEASGMKLISTLILSKIKSRSYGPWLQTLQYPSTREGPLFGPNKTSYSTEVVEYIQHVCAMNCYRQFSPEELRLNDYHREQDPRSSSAPRPLAGTSTEVSAPEQPAHTTQASKFKQTSLPTNEAVTASRMGSYQRLGALLTMLLLGLVLGLTFDFQRNLLQSVFCTKALRLG